MKNQRARKLRANGLVMRLFSKGEKKKTNQQQLNWFWNHILPMVVPDSGPVTTKQSRQ